MEDWGVYSGEMFKSNQIVLVTCSEMLTLQAPNQQRILKNMNKNKK
jgi:hypothetical protein